MPKHARTKQPHVFPRALLNAAVTATSAAAALAAGGWATASAAPGPRAAVSALQSSAGHALAPAKNLKPDPLAKTGVDPLDNKVGTGLADFRPVTTGIVTDPVTRGDSLGELPLVGDAAKVLPG